MWSVSNETPIKPERLVFLKRLVADARLLDATRLITSAMDHFDEDSPNLRALRDPSASFSMCWASTNTLAGTNGVRKTQTLCSGRVFGTSR